MATAWVDPLLFAIACLGGGGVLLSLWIGLAPAQASARKLAAQITLGVLALAAGAFAFVAWLESQPAGLWMSAGALVILYVLLVLAPSQGFGSCAGKLCRWAQTRHGRLTAMLIMWATCPFLALYLVCRDLEVPPPMSEGDATARFVDNDSLRPTPSPSSPLTTDRGRPISTLIGPNPTASSAELLAAQSRLLATRGLAGEVIALPTGWQDCNCHGFVFAGGKYWIAGKQIDPILDDNGYRLVTPPQADDVAIYRGDAGQVLHSGIVRGLTGDRVVLVESKWGSMGRFIHPHDRHIYPDAVCTFYRSDRPGHLLRGAELADRNAPGAVSEPSRQSTPAK